MRAIVLRLKGMGYFGSFYRDRGYVRLSIGFDDHSQNKLKEKSRELEIMTSIGGV